MRSVLSLTEKILIVLVVAAVILVVGDARADGYDEYCLGYYDGYQEGYCQGDVSCIAPTTYCPPPRPGDVLDYFHGFSFGNLQGYADAP